MIFLTSSRLILPTFFCLILSACAQRTAVLNDAFSAIFTGQVDNSDPEKLNRSLRYLRVVASGGVSLLVLGYVEANPSGPIEVWYSSKAEVLRMQNGHVVGLTGTTVEWRHVSLSALPPWHGINSTSMRYTRIRDVMPGYLFGTTDQLDLRLTPAPSRSNISAKPVELAQNLKWFEAREVNKKLPPARFAVETIDGISTAVYGEQCFSPAYCLSWQTWPSLGWVK